MTTVIRHALRGCVASAVAVVAGCWAAAPSIVAAESSTVTGVVRTAPGRDIPASFAGLSIEYSSALDYFGGPGSPNVSFIRLLKTLGAGGAGAPTVRLGGDSSDESWWNPAAGPRPAGIDTDLSASWLSALRPAAEQARVPFVLGLNLVLNDPANALSYAQAAIAGLPAGSVRSLEIGNQPDLYGRSISFEVKGRPVTRIQHRPADWALPNYLTDLDRYLETLTQARQPGWPRLAVGAFAQTSWERSQRAVLEHTGDRVQEFSTHWHPGYTCPTRRHSGPATLRRRLLGPRIMKLVATRVARVVQTARRAGIRVRASEVNSGTCGGLAGMSDTMASALWGTDTLFTLAQLGVEGANLHTFTGAPYAPVEFPLRNGRRIGVAHPLLYGMLLFNRAAPAGARLLPTAQTADPSIETWATIDPTGTVRVVVLNKHGRASRTVRLEVRGRGAGATVRRLLAPSAAARSGVTFAGQRFEGPEFDGRLHGRAVRTVLKAKRGVYTVALSGASAALITIPAARGGDPERR